MSTSEDMPWKAVFLIVILVVSFIGNILVIMVVYRSRRNQWTTNHFVVSLAIVNLLAPTGYLFFTLDSVFRGQWLFGNVSCKLNAFLVYFNALTSVGILCCMSFDRYYLTAYPLTFKLSKTQTKKVILAVSLLAILITSPMAYFYEEHSAKFRQCLPEFSDEWRAYFCCFSMLFLLPHLATYVTYFKVCRCILARNNSLNGARFAQKVPRTKVKVTKLLVAQVIVYTVLFLPYIMYQMIVSICKDASRTSVLTLTYFAYLSSAASPVIYSVFSGDFRRGCKLIFAKYDASIAYRLPVQLERKNRVDVANSDLGNFPMLRSPEKRDSVEPIATEMNFFEQRRFAWPDA